jgi:hypothetical protein
MHRPYNGNNHFIDGKTSGTLSFVCHHHHPPPGVLPITITYFARYVFVILTMMWAFTPR